MKITLYINIIIMWGRDECKLSTKWGSEEDTVFKPFSPLINNSSNHLS